MKTSWIEIKEIEDYLQGKLNAPKALLFKTYLLIDAEREATCVFQQRTYDLVTMYSRKKLKKELAAIEQKLFQEQEHSGFREKIFSLFKMG